MARTFFISQEDSKDLSSWQGISNQDRNTDNVSTGNLTIRFKISWELKGTKNHKIHDLLNMKNDQKQFLYFWN